MLGMLVIQPLHTLPIGSSSKEDLNYSSVSGSSEKKQVLVFKIAVLFKSCMRGSLWTFKDTRKIFR